MLQTCKRHKCNFIHGICPRCSAEQQGAIDNIFRLEHTFKQLQAYSKSGAYALAFKVYMIAKQGLKR
jgi:hypothetical protein